MVYVLWSAILIAAVTYTTVFMLYLRGLRLRRLNSKNRFFIALIEGFKNGSIATLDDVVDVYRGSHTQDLAGPTYRYGLGRHLRECMVKLITKELDPTLDDETICRWKERISGFIRLNEERSPYEELPPTERNLLGDVSEFIQHGNVDGVVRKLHELRGILLAKTDELNRTRGVNRWSVPLSIIGMVFTVVFGLLSILHGV